MRIIKINAKCNDMCNTIVSDDGAVVRSRDGYAPGGLGIGGGDYIRLEIDAETGQILNWKKPETVEDIFE
jgi:hypothetical protein